MELYGVCLGVSNGVNAWAVHSLIDGKEGFFIETSPALVSYAQATHLVGLIKGYPDFSTIWELIEIKPLLTLEQTVQESKIEAAYGADNVSSH